MQQMARKPFMRSTMGHARRLRQEALKKPLSTTKCCGVEAWLTILKQLGLFE
jgi:hypothetical protein